MKMITFIFALLSISLILGFALPIKTKKEKDDVPYCRYDTMFCRNVRASLGMFAYKSDVEETRKWLNSSQSKF